MQQEWFLNSNIAVDFADKRPSQAPVLGFHDLINSLLKLLISRFFITILHSCKSCLGFNDLNLNPKTAGQNLRPVVQPMMNTGLGPCRLAQDR
jgi:hypothetical protein